MVGVAGNWPHADLIAIGTLPQSCEQTQFRRFLVWRDILYYWYLYFCWNLCYVSVLRLWRLHNLQHVSSILDFSFKDTKIEILNYLQLISHFRKIDLCSLSCNCQRTCYKDINCQHYSYIMWQNEILQWRLVQYWRRKTESNSRVVRST